MIMIWKILLIYLAIFFIVTLKFYQSLFPIKQRYSTSLIHSGLLLNSFNPPIIHLSLTKDLSSSNTISILDNNVILFQVFNSSVITMILSDGYHHLDLIISHQIDNIEYHQGIDISIGTQSLLVTVFNKQSQPMRNISVHLELVDYPSIHLDSRTNQFGEVIFAHLPKHIQVYVEAISTETKDYAYAQIDSSNYRNITLIMKKMNVFYDDEYDASDRGYYAV